MSGAASPALDIHRSRAERIGKTSKAREQHERADQLRAGNSVLDRSRHSRSGRRRRVLRPLFGWSVEEDENAEQTGGYRVARLKDKAVGGVMKLMEEGQPPGLGQLRQRRGCRRDRRQSARGRRLGDGRANGRSRLRPDGVRHRSHRGGDRHLGGGRQHRRRPSSTSPAPWFGTSSTRATSAPRGSSTAPSLAGAMKTWRWTTAAPTPGSSSARTRSAECSTSPAAWRVAADPFGAVFAVIKPKPMEGDAS